MDSNKLDVLLKSEMGLRAHAILLKMQGNYEKVGDMQLLKDFGKKDEGISEFLSNEFSESASDDLAKEDEAPDDVESDDMIKQLLLVKNRPPLDWWNNCMQKAKGYSDLPATYCGKMWEEHLENPGECPCGKGKEIGAGDRDLASPDRPKLDDIKPRMVVETN
jgi:hypothetical protein